MRTFALIGRNISYSFSKSFFTEKFSKENIQDAEYINFDIQSIEELPKLIRNTPTLSGMNVTIPYKTTIIPFLDDLDETAKNIGAVNTIVKIPTEENYTKTKSKLENNFILKGYNTDWIGFYDSLFPLLKTHHKQALILGSGGASKAIAFALKKLNINYKIVSRVPDNEKISYNDLHRLIPNHFLIINTTPIGTSPRIDHCPNIPYNLLSANHIAYDLIYNPAQTLFLKKATQAGAVTQNGHQMLVKQAQAAWMLWNKTS